MSTHWSNHGVVLQDNSSRDDDDEITYARKDGDHYTNKNCGE